jgi:hypothetical protein
MIGTILKLAAEFFFDSVIGKMVAAGLLALTLVGGFALHERSVGAEQVLSKINSQAEKLGEKARDARSAAARPGAAERLRKNACRDC